MQGRRQSPKRGHHWSWSLSDGRFKCRACDTRYRWRSVWQVGHLSEANKKRQLEFFVTGVPIYRARFRSSVSRIAAEKFYRQIRQLMALHDELAAPLVGSVECDETMFDGRRKGKRGWGAAGKVLVFGMFKRDGVVRVFPVESRSRMTLLPMIAQHTTPDSLYFTYEWHAYTALALRGTHIVVSKERGIPK